MEELLTEECNVSSKRDSDIGDIKDFAMKINLSDEIPVKDAYTHLYEEVRNYVNDLLVNGWIQESFSAYASLFVCVQKKDSSLHMCVDYCKLNNKTIPDSQPIPRIQDILYNLHGHSWFTTLDMYIAYHQGYIDEDFVIALRFPHPGHYSNGYVYRLACKMLLLSSAMSTNVFII